MDDKAAGPQAPQVAVASGEPALGAGAGRGVVALRALPDWVGARAEFRPHTGRTNPTGAGRPLVQWVGGGGGGGWEKAVKRLRCLGLPGGCCSPFSPK